MLTAIGAYLLLIAQGNFFTGKVEPTADHMCLSFIDRKHVCYFYPSYNPDFCNKPPANANHLKRIKKNISFNFAASERSYILQSNL